MFQQQNANTGTTLSLSRPYFIAARWLCCCYANSQMLFRIFQSHSVMGCMWLIWVDSCSHGWMHANLIYARQCAHIEFITKVLTLFFCVNICCLYSAEITTLSSPLWQLRLHFRVHYDKARWGVFDWLNAQCLWRVIAPVQQRPVRRNLRSSLSSLKCLLLLIARAGAKHRSWNLSLMSAGLGRFGDVFSLCRSAGCRKPQ